MSLSSSRRNTSGTSSFRIDTSCMAESRVIILRRARGVSTKKKKKLASQSESDQENKNGRLRAIAWISVLPCRSP